jgi:hypothetical protein
MAADDEGTLSPTCFRCSRGCDLERECEVGAEMASRGLLARCTFAGISSDSLMGDQIERSPCAGAVASSSSEEFVAPCSRSLIIDSDPELEASTIYLRATTAFFLFSSFFFYYYYKWPSAFSCGNSQRRNVRARQPPLL